MRKIENEIDDFYSDHFITVSTSGKLDQLKVTTQLYPQVFENIFDKKDLQNIKTPLVWVKMRFQPNVPFEALDNIWCSINSFPVLNRRLNKFSYKLLQNLNIVFLKRMVFFFL